MARIKSVKATFDGEIRRVTATYFMQDDAVLDWERFVARIQQLFGQPSSSVDLIKVQYNDSEGDKITVSSTEELEEAFRTPVQTLYLTVTYAQQVEQVQEPGPQNNERNEESNRTRQQPRKQMNLFDNIRRFAKQQWTTAQAGSGWRTRPTGSWMWPSTATYPQYESPEAELEALEQRLKDDTCAANPKLHLRYAVLLSQASRFDEAVNELATGAALGLSEPQLIINEPVFRPSTPAFDSLPEIIKTVIQNLVQKVQRGENGKKFVENQVNRLVCSTMELKLDDCLERARVAGIAGVDIFPQCSPLWYNLACIDSLANNLDSAVSNLASAVQTGYSDWQHMCEDEDLCNLRSSYHWNGFVADTLAKVTTANLLATTVNTQVQPNAPIPVEEEPQPYVTAQAPELVPDEEKVIVAGLRRDCSDDSTIKVVEEVDEIHIDEEDPIVVPLPTCPPHPVAIDDDSDQEGDYSFDTYSSVSSSIEVLDNDNVQQLLDMGFNKTAKELQEMLNEQNGDLRAVVGILVNFE